MTPEAQRLAIARACGWQFLPGQNVSPSGSKWSAHKDPMSGVPHYCDLDDSIHEAARGLLFSRRYRFAEELIKIISPEGIVLTKESCVVGAMIAKPQEKAEAFLRSMDLWTD